MKNITSYRCTIPVVFAIDRRMEMPAGVCIFSLLENARPDTFYDIYILHPEGIDLSGSRIARLRERYSSCMITFVAVDDVFSKAFVIRGISIVTYYRLLIPDILPQFNKVVYSDVDVIFRSDLQKYFDTSVDGYYFAGVDALPYFPESIRSYAASELGLPPDDGYFYAGNLVVNSQMLRENGMVGSFLKRANASRYKYQDMDIMNLLCHGKIKRLPESFCLTTYIYDAWIREGRHMLSDADIIHYNGTKPWEGLCPHLDLWWEYYRKSDFFDEKFAYDFWISQRDCLQRMPLGKRIKQLLRYPLDRKEW